MTKEAPIVVVRQIAGEIKDRAISDSVPRKKTSGVMVAMSSETMEYTGWLMKAKSELDGKDLMGEVGMELVNWLYQSPAIKQEELTGRSATIFKDLVGWQKDARGNWKDGDISMSMVIDLAKDFAVRLTQKPQLLARAQDFFGMVFENELVELQTMDDVSEVQEQVDLLKGEQAGKNFAMLITPRNLEMGGGANEAGVDIDRIANLLGIKDNIVSQAQSTLKHLNTRYKVWQSNPDSQLVKNYTDGVKNSLSHFMNAVEVEQDILGTMAGVAALEIFNAGESVDQDWMLARWHEIYGEYLKTESVEGGLFAVLGNVKEQQHYGFKEFKTKIFDLVVPKSQ